MASPPDPRSHGSHSKAVEICNDPVTTHIETPDKPNDPGQFGFTEDEQKRLIRRIDFRLIPMVGLMYCVSLIDRTNVAAASIAGMMEDLQLIGNRYVSWLRYGGFSMIPY